MKVLKLSLISWGVLLTVVLGSIELGEVLGFSNWHTQAGRAETFSAILLNASVSPPMEKKRQR